MRKFYYFCFLTAIFVNSLFAQDTSQVTADTIKTISPQSLPAESGQREVNPPVQDFAYPEVENHAFAVGEKLTFKIRYGFIRAGTATMEVREIKPWDNERQVYHIVTTAKSVPAFNWIYKVDDLVETFMDKQGLFSWAFNKRLREGNYKADLSVRYLHRDSTAMVKFIRYKDNMKIRKKEEFTVKIPPFVQDILSAFYYVRTQPLQVGRSFYLTNHDYKKVYPLEIKIYRKEVLKVKAGKFRCIVLEPLLKGEGIFKQKGRLVIWLTDDEYKIPVQMKSKVIVGHITTELEKIEGISGKIPAQLD